MKIFCVLAFACLTRAELSSRGVKIRSEMASVEFGLKGDVALRRKSGALKVEAKFLQADAYKVGNMDLDAYIEATIRKRITPHIKACVGGYKGPFCDVMCTNADLKIEMYSQNCETKCKPGFSLLDGKCTDVKGAPCNIPNSNMLPGPLCKCKNFFGGKIQWKGAVVSGNCEACGTVSGFNADLTATITAQAGWKAITNWRTNANNELYENGGEFNNGNGRFYPKKDGYFLCNTNVRLDGFTSAGYSRLLIAINGVKDVNNGLHTIEGNGGSTNFRSMMVSGTLKLKQGQYASVFVHSNGDNSYKIHTESGFSCHQIDNSVGFHAEKNGNMDVGKAWVEVTKWRVTGTDSVYNAGGGFSVGTSRYTAPASGVHYCYAMIRMDQATRSGYIRLNLNLNAKPDTSNGFHAIRGNRDSSNYGSLNVAGTIYLVKDSFMSVYVYSSADASWKVQSESGWGCHMLGSNVGFHADATSHQDFGKLWSRVSKWRTTGNNELYAMGGAGVSTTGYFTAPYFGYYACATQVRIDLGNNGYFRLLMAVNGQTDVNNGMHAISGNQGSSNFRTMRVAGIVRLDKGNKISVHVYSATDTQWRLNQESGFSCNRLKSRPACPSCSNIVNSNKKRGPECACKGGYTGKIAWKENVPSGTCSVASCNVANSNMKPGPACKCKDGFKGKITWAGGKASGTCKVAPCWIMGSNKLPGVACKCLPLHSGKVTWVGGKASGSCTVCGTNSGFNADLTSSIKVTVKSWKEITNWRTNGNNEMYETNQNEFDSTTGRFAPKETGYYLCNANIRLDGFAKTAYSRLIIAINGGKDVNNGMHTIEGNGGSTNYRSMMVSGNVVIKKGQYVSAFVFSSTDSAYTIHSESGFSCHQFDTKVGFHTEKSGSQTMKTAWIELKSWRVAGVAGLYNVGGGYSLTSGRYTSPVNGVFFCTAMVRYDAAATSGYFRLNLVLNKQNDNSNGFHAIRGNKASTNYGSLNLAGTINLKKGDYVSLLAFSSSDSSYKVQSETGWGCHMMGTKIGFHADASKDQTFSSGWRRMSAWRTTGNVELYAMGGAKVSATGMFAAPEPGYYACATQVRIGGASSSSYFRLLLAINGQLDNNNGMHTIEGNMGSTNYRSMRVAGTAYLKRGDTVSVNVYSRSDTNWKLQHESGFSCHMFTSRVITCPKCNVPMSNKLGGPACKCLPGYKGKIVWQGTSATGTCTVSKCDINNSNKKDGAACKCNNFFNGEIKWTEKGATGSCRACGPAKGFNADLVTTINAKAGWREINNWRTTGNNEMYESDRSFENGNGRFRPKMNGYYLCNANVRLDGFTSTGYSRLIIAVSGAKDVNNGLHTIEGNGGSTNYRSMMVSGTLQLKSTEYASVFVFSSNDNSYRIHSESGFSCQILHSPYGFHAEKNGNQNMVKGWKEVGNWRVTGLAGLYNVGGGFNTQSGRYTTISAGVHYCYAMVRMDGASKAVGNYFTLNLNLNNGLDVNNGFHAIRGNKDSENYGSLNVAGTLNLKKGDIVSVYVYSNQDNSWRVQGESGWGCHKLGSNTGFHADASVTQTFKNGWSRVAKWRTSSNNELYNMGGPGISDAGLWTVPSDGYYVCAAQVRIDAGDAGSNYFRLIISINGGNDINNGMHSIDGNQGSTNYRTMRVAGTVALKTGNTVSVSIYARTDTNWKLHTSSGFSCGKTYAKIACPACTIANSNKIAGKKCACKPGYSGKITWMDNKPSGVCKALPCTVANSNKKAGSACACADGFKGAIKWKGSTASGTCQPAPCKVANSNKLPGTKCKCVKPYAGTLSWNGAAVSGTCEKCGPNSGFNADLTGAISATKGWKELTGWRTNTNTELYESNGEFDNTKGRFSPKVSGYYLCNTNVRLDNFASSSYSRLLIGVNGAKNINNGLHTIEGNSGSTNYRSMMVAGNLKLNKGQFASVMVFSSNDNSYRIQSDSGFSCHAFSTKFGFHADKANNQNMIAGWKEVSNWRPTGSGGPYLVGGGFSQTTGRYTAPVAGAFFCSAMVRFDTAASSSYFRLNINLNLKADNNNGFHAIRGNKGSQNYGSLNVAGSIYLKKKDIVSVYVYSRSDNSWRVQSESGWGCHMMGTGVGFHADASADQTFSTNWNRLNKWRTAGNDELYSQGGGPNSQGYYNAPQAGYYACATQVRIDSANTVYFRLLIAINGQTDIQNGLHAISGNQGSTNYRTMRVAGTVFLKKGDRTSVHVYSKSDTSWKAQHESGFSCHMFVTRQKC